MLKFLFSSNNLFSLRNLQWLLLLFVSNLNNLSESKIKKKKSLNPSIRGIIYFLIFKRKNKIKEKLNPSLL